MRLSLARKRLIFTRATLPGAASTQEYERLFIAAFTCATCARGPCASAALPSSTKGNFDTLPLPAHLIAQVCPAKGVQLALVWR